MIKKFVFLALCLSGSMMAHETMDSEQEELQVGRYQMLDFSTNSHSYIFDTATGCIWRSQSKNAWTGEEAHWELKIGAPKQ